MPSTSSLVRTLKRDFPQFTLIKSELFMWSPGEQAIYYCPLRSAPDRYRLLHEFAHAVLLHTDFEHDADLLRKEVEAWEYAKTILAPAYTSAIPDDFIQEALETYRIWLHNRSTCPTCSQNGLQTQNDTYVCLNCRCRWRVNDARQCQLKRYMLTQPADR